jgi:hypothetical protein
MVWKASVLQACEAISFLAARILVIKKRAARPFFFRNQLLDGIVGRCVDGKAPLLPPSSFAFALGVAHVLSPGMGSVP